MVVAQEKIAAQIGADVLKRGGNAVDAAVATGFAMAVTYPRAGNIGGGGFMVIHSAERHEDIAIDYRETAPAATTPDIFSGPTASPISQSRAIPRSASAFPAPSPDWRWRWKNMARANSRWRNCCSRRSIWRATGSSSPTTSPTRCRTGTRAAGALAVVGRRYFPRADGTPLREGDRLVQTDLAATLSAIAEQGPRGFYQGPVAEKLVKAIRDAGGIMTLGRSEILSGRPSARRCAAAIAATTSSRCRCHRPAASCCWRP